MEDQEIVIYLEFDDKEANQQLDQLIDKIEDLNDQINRMKRMRLPLLAQSKELKNRMEAAEAAAREIERTLSNTAGINQQKAQIQQLQTEWDSVQAKIQACNQEMEKANEELSESQEKAGSLLLQISQPEEKEAESASIPEKAAGDAQAQEALAQDVPPQETKTIDKMKNAAKELTTRLGSGVESVFSTVIASPAKEVLQEWFGKIIANSAEASGALARLKGAFLTMVQPFASVIIPVLTTFVNVLTRIVSAAAGIISGLFGTTVEESAQSAQALYQQTDAVDGVGDAAKKAAKSFASFDEINQLPGSSDQSSGSGAGASASSGSAPDFSGTVGDGLTAVVELFVGAALLALGAILTFSGVNVLLGIGLMAAGALAVWDAVSSNWGAISAMLQGPIGILVGILSGALLVLGAILIFSGVSLPLGLGLMVAGAVGLASVVAANWEYISTALQGPLGALVALLGTALLVLGAILTFTGANLPLGIGLMIVGAAGLAAAVAANWEYISTALQGPLGVLVALLGTALLVLGAILTFTGANLPLGIGLLVAGAASLAGVVAVNWETIITSLQGPIGEVAALVSTSLLVLGILLCLSGVNLPLGIALIAAGAVGLVTVAALNWDAILTKLKEVWTKIREWWDTHVAKFFSVDFWKQLGKDMINGFLETLENGINFVLSGIGDMANGIISTLNKIPGVSIEHVEWGNVELPRLAKGAVIPPNREFLAVLGDQHSGTNVEAPLSTIEQAVTNALSRMGYGGEQTVILQLDKQQLGKVVYQLNHAESRRIGVTLAGV